MSEAPPLPAFLVAFDHTTNTITIFRAGSWASGLEGTAFKRSVSTPQTLWDIIKLEYFEPGAFHRAVVESSPTAKALAEVERKRIMDEFIASHGIQRNRPAKPRPTPAPVISLEDLGL